MRIVVKKRFRDKYTDEVYEAGREDMIRKMLLKKNIDISEEQLDTLIEAAVKAMKMQGPQNIKIKTFGL